MFRNEKSTLVLKVFVVFVSIAMTTVGFSASTNSARVIPTGKVSIIKDNKVVGEFSKESPLPEGAFLRCEAKCTVKMEDISMVAEPDTLFSINRLANSNELTVREGTVYFTLSEGSRPLEFNTPAGDASTSEVLLSKDELMGYVKVSGNETQIGVIDGGTMMVETSNGEMAIPPGKQVTIALVNPDAPVAEGDEGGSGGIKRIGLYAAEAAVLVGGVYLLSTIGGTSSNDDDGSPSSP
jgi:hypothetical protein